MIWKWLNADCCMLIELRSSPSGFDDHIRLSVLAVNRQSAVNSQQSGSRIRS